MLVFGEVVGELFVGMDLVDSSCGAEGAFILIPGESDGDAGAAYKI